LSNPYHWRLRRTVTDKFMHWMNDLWYAQYGIIDSFKQMYTMN